MMDNLIMNPPYKGNLHLDVVKEAIKHCNNLAVSLQPNNWLKINTLEKDFVNSLTPYIKDEECFEAEDLDKKFNIYASFDASIFTFDKKKPNTYLIRNIRYINIVNKIRKVCSWRSVLPFLLGKYTLPMQGDYGYARRWKYTIDQILNGDPKSKLRFETEKEKDNFYNSRLTWPNKVMYVLDDFAAVPAHFPYYGDYSHVWTDEMCYRYFKITDEEYSLIKELLDIYDNPSKIENLIIEKETSMTLSQDIKNNIIEEFNSWKTSQYAGKDKDWQQQMGAFYTPPELTIQMIEKFDNLNGTICDPTCGCGGLLAACILAGADPNKCYGIELDPDILELARERLGKLGVPKYNLHLGNALNEDCYDNFNDKYSYDLKTDMVKIQGSNNFMFKKQRI